MIGLLLISFIEIEAGPEEALPAEKGLKEKKRKLHETLQRIILYHVIKLHA